jgi:hypothetical protein
VLGDVVAPVRDGPEWLAVLLVLSVLSGLVATRCAVAMALAGARRLSTGSWPMARRPAVDLARSPVRAAASAGPSGQAAP